MFQFQTRDVPERECGRQDFAIFRSAVSVNSPFCNVLLTEPTDTRIETTA
jgi:hypothetical protein